MAVTFVDNWEEKTFIGTSEKRKSKYVIYKAPNGFSFFQVKLDKAGITPEELSGNYTTVAKAKEAILAYDNGIKETQAAKNEYFQEQRELRKNAKTPAEAD